MMSSPSSARRKLELVDRRPNASVVEAEYRRLLGYPPDYAPSDRARELAEWARAWYAANGQPWVYLREAEAEIGDRALRLDGIEFRSRQLHRHLQEAGARRAMLVAASAGRACEEQARRLWQEAKPDEYFFLEIFGSAVVEHLVAAMSGRICELAERDGLMAIRHYSPGYTGWDVADQTKLLPLIRDGASEALPESVTVLPSGMLHPKKSLLAVFGLVPRNPATLAAAPLVPCGECGFSPCGYRRAPYRHAPEESVPSRAGVSPASAKRAGGDAGAAPAGATPYTVSIRALQKWAGERVRVEAGAGGTTVATFRFDGTTCANLGRPLAFDYALTLGPAEEGHRILHAACHPAAGDDGYQHMCAYLSDAEALMRAIATEAPLTGQPLNDVLAWPRDCPPSGCHCTAMSRAHKWRLALEAIHYALAHASSSAPTAP